MTSNEDSPEDRNFRNTSNKDDDSLEKDESSTEDCSSKNTSDNDDDFLKNDESSSEDVSLWNISDNDDGSKTEEECEYKTLTIDEVEKQMEDCITDVSATIKLPRKIARILLDHFKWDKEKLLKKYYDGSQEFFREAQTDRYDEVCEICFSRYPPNMMTGLECGHRFCKQCWSVYLMTKKEDQSIPCAAHGCDILHAQPLPDPKVHVNYKKLITNSFVECNRLLRWCPAAGCTYAVKVTNVETRRVICKCHQKFCFDCGENWHDPVQCRLFKCWLKNIDDDLETSNWIAANTKKCPKCNVTIEKDGGSNKMKCINCNQYFCWVCLGEWEPHNSWHNCNRYDEDEAKAARDAQEKLRSSLSRFLHYYNRYMNHMQSLKFENKLYASVKHKMDEMQQHKMLWIEVRFLKKAVHILCQCWQTLMCTYVFAYYLKKNNQSMIFEDNQKDLETATKKLSEYLECDITSENLADIRQKVQDKYWYCEKRRKVLLDHVHEGYEKDWWDYTE